jgi:hypothetical protein
MAAPSASRARKSRTTPTHQAEPATRGRDGPGVPGTAHDLRGLTVRQPARCAPRGSGYRGDRGGGGRTSLQRPPDKSSSRIGLTSLLHVRGRRRKTKTLVTGLEAARGPDMPSKSVGGRKLAGGFDSRPPPLLKAPSDQRRSAEPGEEQPQEGPDPSPNDRVHHTSLSVLPPPGAGQVFRPPAGGPFKFSDSLSRRDRRKRHGPPVGRPMAR